MSGAFCHDRGILLLYFYQPQLILGSCDEIPWRSVLCVVLAGIYSPPIYFACYQFRRRGTISVKGN